MRSVELFVGAGGLALGCSIAGFHHEAVIEWDQDACDTIRKNMCLGVEPVINWPLQQIDVREFDFSAIPDGIDLLAGGPPCQPFSLGGKHRGHWDERNMFPEMVKVIRDLKPRAVIIENVKGLLRPSFAKYFEYIILQITYPEIIRKPNEDWTGHLCRLEGYHTRGKPRGLHYRVVFRCLNAADYGVPQRRERVFIVAFRDDIARQWAFPNPTHTLEALLRDMWISGEYWERHEIPRKQRLKTPEGIRDRIRRQGRLFSPTTRPWRTVRDALAGLPDPERHRDGEGIANHEFRPGARPYPGHTGSPLDLPAKTLKAGDHGVPGGENMLAHPNGRVRYFTVRESARLQTFPDEYIFQGSWTETMRQLGNAVPVNLATVVAASVKACLEERTSIQPSRQAEPWRERCGVPAQAPH